ncbi:OmpA family protein [Salinihabitans flavidus]|nr:OmpA family protein [Salinihabitans flavidus]
MIRTHHSLAIALTAAITLGACTDPGQVGADNRTQQGALLGGALGAAAGLFSTDDKAKGALVGGALGAAGGAIIGSQLDKQEADLRRQMDNDDVVINNTGDRLIVTMAQDILFATDSFTVRPDLRRDLGALSTNLRNYPNSRIQVLGHTDNTGSAAYNQQLSERRAGAVANVLLDNGVSNSRIRTIGRGEDQPVATNLTVEGRAQNRRVEIVILPNSG